MSAQEERDRTATFIVIAMLLFSLVSYLAGRSEGESIQMHRCVTVGGYMQ